MYQYQRIVLLILGLMLLGCTTDLVVRKVTPETKDVLGLRYYLPRLVNQPAA